MKNWEIKKLRNWEMIRINNYLVFSLFIKWLSVIVYKINEMIVDNLMLIMVSIFN